LVNQIDSTVSSVPAFAFVHYGKIRRCRAAKLCRELLHGKDFFAVRSKKSARQRKNARQSMRAAHGKET
jgi:hypothetical protein